MRPVHSLHPLNLLNLFNLPISLFCFFVLFTQSFQIHAQQPTPTQLAVWANEAVVATYTYDYRDFITQQQAIAKYFTAKGWTQYSAALNKAKLPQQVAKNSYTVSAVALLPVRVKTLGSLHWEATMPLVVLYNNPQYQQKQTLEVTIQFEATPANQGVRGLAITSLVSKPIKDPCACPLAQ